MSPPVALEYDRFVAFPRIVPIAPIRIREAFDHRDWIFEPKLDGFLVLAYVADGGCTIISRRRHTYKAFAPLADAIAAALRCRQAVLDGEIVCLNEAGSHSSTRSCSARAALVLRVDLLWLDGQDLRSLSLLKRKRRLRRLVPRADSRLLYLDHVGVAAICFALRASRRRGRHGLGCAALSLL